VPWWNTETAEWQVARLPERSITIRAAAEAPVPLPEAEATTTAADATDEVLQPSMPGGFWRRVSELLAAVWLVTLLAWWWTSRPAKREPRQPVPVPLHKRQSKLLKTARKAARDGDSNGVKQALLEWAALEWPDDAPRSIGALSQRVSAELADELNAFSKLSYGPSPGDFDGDALAKAIRSFSVLTDGQSEATEELPPLMPSA
jgi:hypothetical protein